MAKVFGVRGSGRIFTRNHLEGLQRVRRAGEGGLVGHHRQATETQINSGYNQGL